MSSRRFLPVAALLALAAWANAQAMTCCWVPDAWKSLQAGASEIVEFTSSAPSASSTAPMAADHSCCPGSRDAEGSESPRSATPGAPMPGCGMDAQGVTSPCCESGETAAVSATSGAAYDVASGTMGTILLTESRLEAVPAQESPPWLVLSSPPDGPPSFLSFQRLLI